MEKYIFILNLFHDIKKYKAKELERQIDSGYYERLML